MGFVSPPRRPARLRAAEQEATLVLTSRPRATTVNVWHPSGSVVAPGRLLRSRSGGSGKPMPAAGETAHV